MSPRALGPTSLLILGPTSASCHLCPMFRHPCSGRQVAGLGVVGQLQRHVWGWQPATGARLLRAFLRGSRLPGAPG